MQTPVTRAVEGKGLKIQMRPELILGFGSYLFLRPLRLPNLIPASSETWISRCTTMASFFYFAEYCEKVRRLAAEELGINIPNPNEVAV